MFGAKAQMAALCMAQPFADRMGAGMTGAMPRLLASHEHVGARRAVRAVVGPMVHLSASQGRPVPASLQSQLA